MNDQAKSRGPASSRALFGRLGLMVLAVGFVVALAVINVVFRGVRLDLTENDLYTLSDGTKKILGNIPEPLNIYLYFSDRPTADIPYLRSYADRVREMLQEFASRSGGKINLKVIDPVPFSEDEDRAAQFGLRPANLGNNPDPVYFGIAGTNGVGDQQVIPFLDPGKEQFLEYDLARLVYSLANPKKPVVGLISGLPMAAGFDPMSQQVREPWAIVGQMGQLFDLRSLDGSVKKIPDEIRVLVVAHPKDLGEATQYAIDQFVMRGGRALFFVDPYSEIDRGDPDNPASLIVGRSSNLDRLLGAWGVKVEPGQAVLDDRYALTVGGVSDRPFRHLGIQGIDPQGMAQDDVVTSGLTMVDVGFPGAIVKSGEGGATVTPLLRSSELAGLVQATSLPMIRDPEMLRADFKPAGQRYTLAARLTGNVPSAFPDGPPGGGDKAGHLAASSGPINVILVADTDILSDRLWIQAMPVLGQRVPTAFANNGDFVINAIDNLLGSSDLISIHSRATFTRPFQRVVDLRREAEGRFRETEKNLQQELQETEQRLGELQASRKDQGAQILTKEQQDEIQRFQSRRVELRKELRQVQRGLDRDIENLGTALKLINIAVVPLLISLASVVVLYLRRRARRGSPRP